MGSDFGPPSDLFSLGVTLYTAIEGRPPFDKGDPIETMHAVVEDPPTPTSRAGSLDTVLMGLLEKDPSRRFDVQTARTMLRQQLAGPLASKAPPHMMTDPYSVVPSQRPAAVETQPIPPQPQPSGQIGGRAMLAPGDSLSGHLAKITKKGRRRAEEARPESMTQTMPGVPHVGAPGRDADATAVVPPRQAWDGARAARDPWPGTVVQSPSAKRRAMVDNAVGAVRHTATQVVTTVKGWPRRQQMIAGGGALGVVLLLVLVVALSGGDDPASTEANPAQSQAPAAASFATQTYDDRGINVNVPKDWTRNEPDRGGVWVDYVDPGNKLRKVRILVEPSKATPEKFLGVAEATLRKSANCPKPFNRVALNRQAIAGRDGAVMEYTCGTGAEARHGLWGAVVENGKAYSFYLTTTDETFGDSRQIFDEMVRTYTLEKA
jgi:hypothetical protein